MQCFNFQVYKDQTNLTANNVMTMGEKPISPVCFSQLDHLTKYVSPLHRGHAGTHQIIPIFIYVLSEKCAHVFNESNNRQNALKFLVPQNKNVYTLQSKLLLQAINLKKCSSLHVGKDENTKIEIRVKLTEASLQTIESNHSLVGAYLMIMIYHITKLKLQNQRTYMNSYGNTSKVID